MFEFAYDNYKFLCVADGLPNMYDEYCKNAKLVDEIDLEKEKGQICFLGVQDGNDWPFLVVVLKYWPSVAGFYPSAFIVPETQLLFFGAGERIMAYKLIDPAKIWEDSAELGLLRWDRHEQYIIMSAELGIAVWNIYGRKLWSNFLEPPWNYRIESKKMHLEVMGKQFIFSLQEGPTEQLQWLG